MLNNKATASEMLAFITKLPISVVVETYMRPKGTFYYPYLNSLISSFSASKWGTEFEKKFGWQTNTLVSQNEIEYDEFKEYYVFGKFDSVRSYIPYLYGLTGKLLTREKLFEYVLND